VQRVVPNATRVIRVTAVGGGQTGASGARERRVYRGLERDDRETALIDDDLCHRRGTEGRGAVGEGHGAGRRRAAVRGDRRGQGHSLPRGDGVWRERQRGRGPGLTDRERPLVRCARGEGSVTGVDGDDVVVGPGRQITAGRQRGGGARDWCTADLQ